VSDAGERLVKATEVRPGDRVRARDIDLTVTRIDHPFLGREGMLAYVEDSEAQWIKVPVALDAEVLVVAPASS